MDRGPALEFTLAAPTVFVMRREFTAPRALVWRAWTEPAQIVRWFGPHGFTTSVVEADLRPGGRMHFVMRSAEGRDYPVTGIYREIVPPVRLVYSEIRDQPGLPRKESLVTITLLERAGRTQFTMHTEFASAADRDEALSMGVERGWTEAFERLAALAG